MKIQFNSNKISLQQLLILCASYGKKVRNANADGLKSWNELKAVIPKITLGKKWNEKLFSMYRYKIDNLNIVEENDGTLTHEEWEAQHFFLQHSRIPTLNKDEVNLIRLMQIFYNMGQFLSLCDKNKYSEKILSYYCSNELIKLSTYLNVNGKMIITVTPKLIETINKY